MSLLIKNGTLVSFSEDAPLFIKSGAIITDDKKIKKIGRADELEKEFEGGKIIDAKGGIVMPGLINAHNHLYSSLARGLPFPFEPPSNFSEILERLWWRLDSVLDKDSIYWSAIVGIIDSLRYGVTTIIDHHASYGYIKGSLEIVKEAAEMLGVRLATCYEVSDRNGREQSDAAIQENVDFIEKYQHNPMIAGLFGLHASFTLEEKTLNTVSDLVDKLNTGVHIHLAEDETDEIKSIELSGKRAGVRLYDYGLLNSSGIVAHAIHTNDEEQKLLAKSGVFIVHNPESNMNNAVGIAPLLSLKEKGAKIGLGTDGYSFNMLTSFRVAQLLQKLREKDPRVGTDLSLNALFTGNSRFASKLFGTNLGSLKEGSAADIIIIPYNPPTPLHKDNLVGHLIFGFSQLIPNTVIVNGKIVINENVLLTANESELNSEAIKVAQKLWERFVE